MHALSLLITLVDPYFILFHHVAPRPATDVRFGDEPNPEARLYLARRGQIEPTRPR